MAKGIKIMNIVNSFLYCNFNPRLKNSGVCLCMYIDVYRLLIHINAFKLTSCRLINMRTHVIQYIETNKHFSTIKKIAHAYNSASKHIPYIMHMNNTSVEQVI
jgi:hypothetical protein